MDSNKQLYLKLCKESNNPKIKLIYLKRGGFITEEQYKKANSKCARQYALKEETKTCEWCNEEYEVSDLTKTDIGYLCDTCIRAITSRGESIAIEN